MTSDLELLGARFDSALGLALLAADRYPEAEQALRRALGVVAESDDASALFRALLARGAFSEARRCAEQYLPDSAEILAAAIDILSGANPASGWLARLRQDSDARIPRDRALGFWSGLLAQAAGDTAAAIAHFESFVSRARHPADWAYREACRRLARLDGNEPETAREDGFQFTNPPPVDDREVVAWVTEDDLVTDFDTACLEVLRRAEERARQDGRACACSADLLQSMIEHSGSESPDEEWPLEELTAAAGARGTDEPCVGRFSKPVWRALSGARWLARLARSATASAGLIHLSAALALTPETTTHSLLAWATDRTYHFYHLLDASYGLDALQYRWFEQVLSEEPDQTIARALCVFGTLPDGRRARNINHVLWCIRRFPRAHGIAHPACRITKADNDPQVYLDTVLAWRGHVMAEPDDLMLLENAGHFFTLFDLNLALALFERAQQRDPENLRRLHDLAHTYRLGLGRDPDGRHRAGALKASQMAVALLPTEVEAPADRQDPSMTFITALTTLDEAIGVCVQTETWDPLEPLARRLLALAPGDLMGIAAHRGHLALGHLALNRGDVDDAKHELLLAAQVDGGPTLCSFGPNMGLALRLLQLGERQAVLDYFAACGKFWDMGADTLKTWTQSVERGDIPDFRANLTY